MGWARLWATFSQTHLVTLSGSKILTSTRAATERVSSGLTTPGTAGCTTYTRKVCRNTTELK
jgi:hypothetical protein